MISLEQTQKNTKVTNMSNETSFSNIDIIKPLPTPVYSFL